MNPITQSVIGFSNLGERTLMGRKPVLTVAGTLFTSLALAGCQSSSNTRPTAPFVPPSSAAANQNKPLTNTPSGPMAATNTNLPSGGLGPTGMPGQSGNSLAPAGLT